MKLFAKYNRIIATVTVLIVLIAGIGFYLALKAVQQQQVDSDLEIQEREIKMHIAKYGALPVAMSVEDQLVQFIPVTEPYKRRHFSKSELNDLRGEEEDYRQLTFGIQSKGKMYKVIISKSMEETDDLMQTTFAITAVTILLMLISLLIINRRILKNLWHPFYKTLDGVKDFKVNSDSPIRFPVTDTKEFTEMIQTLDDSISRAKTDYLTLKTFSENASHEIQTPIAIIRSKVDMLMQDEKLTEKQSNTLSVISSSIDKLSRMNSSLLLLAKIENGQFSAKQEIWLDRSVQMKIDDFQELWQLRGISVEASLHSSIINMNAELLDILLNNLFSNATWYNKENGKIFVRVEQRIFTIANTSDEQRLDATKIFQRFYKPSPTVQNGLGLSIIKQISEAANIKIEYSYVEQLHSFKLEW